MTEEFENIVGILLVREGCYTVQAHPFAYLLLPGAKVVAHYHVCGEVLNPTALLMDTLVFAGTGHLPAGVMVFSLEKPDKEGQQS